MKLIHAAFALALLASCTPTASEPPAQTPLATAEEIATAQAETLEPRDAEWNARIAPMNLIGNIHYVGPANVSSYLITTDEGHILIDGGFAQSAPIIIENIAELGFAIGDVRYLVNTHAHYDHAAGLAALQRASGATFVASEADKPLLEQGFAGYGPTADVAWPAIRVDRVIADGETVTLGGVTLTAVLTPGHTPGCTSWMMDVTGADGAQHRAFFHCSSTTGGQTLAPPDYPTIVEDFRATFARVRAVEADVFLPNHGNFIDLPARMARRAAGDANAFVDAGALQRFNTQTAAAFERQLAEETAR